MNKQIVLTQLQQFGLDDIETTLYIHLIENGPKTPLDLSRETSVNRSRIYRYIDRLKAKKLIEEVFKKFMDPEIGIDFWTLGLIYKVEVKEDKVKVLMTFTTPHCPYAPMMIEELKEMILKKGAKSAEIEVTFDPPWKPTEELREMLGV